jgi:hypothetical protein
MLDASGVDWSVVYILSTIPHFLSLSIIYST